MIKQSKDTFAVAVHPMQLTLSMFASVDRVNRTLRGTSYRFLSVFTASTIERQSMDSKQNTVWGNGFPIRDEQTYDFTKWTFAQVAEICQRKQIIFRPSSNLQTIRGFTVQYQEVVIISVRTSLAPNEQVTTFGHELGHYALGHTVSTAEGKARDGFVTFQRDPQKEEAARIWAAHLFIDPSLYEDILRGTRVTTRTEEMARSDAAILTARALGIVPEVVTLWERTRDTLFEEHPREWILHS
jgi:Zn-dependent peptidase ImmA (M78 family)